MRDSGKSSLRKSYLTAWMLPEPVSKWVLMSGTLAWSNFQNWESGRVFKTFVVRESRRARGGRTLSLSQSSALYQFSWLSTKGLWPAILLSSTLWSTYHFCPKVRQLLYTHKLNTTDAHEQMLIFQAHINIFVFHIHVPVCLSVFSSIPCPPLMICAGEPQLYLPYITAAGQDVVLEAAKLNGSQRRTWFIGDSGIDGASASWS